MIAYITTLRKQRPTTQLFSLQSIKQDKICNYNLLRSVTAVVLYPGTH